LDAVVNKLLTLQILISCLHLPIGAP
jgi:hypothetical protein